jgi:hypothetical protein
MSSSPSNQPNDPRSSSLNPFADSNASAPYQNTQYYAPTAPSPLASSSAPAGQASTGSPASLNPCLFFVRIPNGQEFGPVDSQTIVEWQKQGRVSDSCFVREQHAPTGLPYAQWLESLQRPAPKPSMVMPDRSVNVYGERFGQANVPANQTAIPLSGNGTLIMWLGICSWILCVTIFGGAILSLIVVIMGAMELGRINSGRSSPEERPQVWIGLGFAIANLAVTFMVLLLFVLSIILNQ